MAMNIYPRMVVGKMAEDVDPRKCNKHLQLREQTGYCFQDFEVDVFGVMAKKSGKMLRRI